MVNQTFALCHHLLEELIFGLAPVQQVVTNIVVKVRVLEGEGGNSSSGHCNLHMKLKHLFLKLKTIIRMIQTMQRKRDVF